MAKGRREDLKTVWEASDNWYVLESTPFDVDGKVYEIGRDFRGYWLADEEAEAEVKLRLKQDGWETIEGLLSRPTIEEADQKYVEFDKKCAKDLSDVTLALKHGQEANEEEEKESSEEKLERSLAAEAFEQAALSEEPAIKATKGNIHSTGNKHRRHWKFCRSSGKIKPWKKVWQPCSNKERSS